MAEHRHKRETTARRMPRATLIAGPLAVLATASVVTLGVFADGPVTQEVAADAPRPVATATTEAPPRQKVISRGAARTKIQPLTKEERITAPTAVRAAVREADTRLWTSGALNLWTEPGEDARKVGVIDAGEKVLVTGREFDGRVEVVVEGAARWVTEGYLTDEDPAEAEPTEAEGESADEAEEPAGTEASCTNGTSVPSGVSPNIAKVHAAVCAAFPDVSTYGTFRGDGEHSQGLAVDIMVSGEEGWRIADFVREHYADLGVAYVIYSQKIWSVERSGEGWRGMEDRGSTTANHYDHVHVTTY